MLKVRVLPDNTAVTSPADVPLTHLLLALLYAKIFDVAGVVNITSVRLATEALEST